MTSGVIPPNIAGRYRVATLVKTYGLDTGLPAIASALENHPVADRAIT